MTVNTMPTLTCQPLYHITILCVDHLNLGSVFRIIKLENGEKLTVVTKFFRAATMTSRIWESERHCDW